MTGAAAEVGSTANNYQILARLASGGMAEIFLARGTSNTGVARYCVLKRILRERANDVNFVRMFLDEARLAAQLQHPNVAQVYDIGMLGDSYFFTMEYVHGETVRSIIHRARSLRREIPISALLTIAAGSAAGLHHAHERLGHDGRPLGIVHRDVSPANLMVSYEGNVKVVDFGVAKAENRATETRSGTVKGKISYLSPEQCKGGDIDRRSDLFALGIVFWEMLAMERLYKRNSDFENMSAIVNETPPLPSTRRPSISPELDAIAMRLLAKNPAERFQSGDELVETLEDVAARAGAMISPSTLGRFLREMFGQRPEPWLELDAAGGGELPASEGVTVTSQPIPASLVSSVIESLDSQLSQVRDLRTNDPAPDVPHEPAAAITARASPAARVPFPLPAPPPSQVSQPAYPSASSQAFAPLDSSSGSYPYTSGSHTAYPMQQDALPPPRRSRSWPLIVIVASAAVIGSLAVWLAMSGDDKPAKVAEAPRDAGAVVEPPVDVAAVVVEPIEIELDAAIPVDAEVVIADAAVASPDAAVDVVLAASAAGRHGEVIDHCVKGVRTEHAAACTLAACHLNLEPKARAWLTKVPGSRRQVLAACRALGVDLAPKRPPPPPRSNDAGVTVDPCIARPQDCQ